MAKNEAEQYVSGEEHLARKNSVPGSRQNLTLPFNAITLVVIAVILCGLSFVAGMAYQKGHTKTTSSANTTGLTGGQGRGGFGRRAGGLGQVTAVSSTSITISNQRTGASTTYSITPSTTITDNGQTVTTSDIQNGSTVLIMTSGSSNTTATSIVVSPNFGGGGGGLGGSSSSSGTTQPPTQTN
ncbi:MAG TPA: hypothetical protein VH234_00755 [Candidatus Saccharimonadales bacterium]|jgi:hypothetical protein|nr:hypothetical protein [Candidatus Saccharimonadales bacterium]